ncbi:adenylate/guanylate cyclase domain-containing protein [Oscillatoria sp. HE19RPO]|uniref:adenylate/guanylate cyclase domain-containing protein n=1 Tax=Oscillatoria sp. HE19RPO TaxID=2954806 RepID=UPI0020C5826D|nr:adenylate/guanylate cyclase domain-containing protein [Oscillatoria sp. HE19RPO]
MQHDFMENNPVASLLTKVLKSPLSPHASRDAEYEAWRDRFMRKRLDVGLWIGLMAFLSSSLLQVSNWLFRPEDFQEAWLRSQVSTELSLLLCLLLQHSKLGRRYPSLVFLAFYWSVTIIPQIQGTLSGVAKPDILVWTIMFFGQATFTPVRWYLHLAAQLGVFLYYLGVNSALGVTFSNPTTWMKPSVMALYFFWVCFIGNLSVYLYEKLQKAEFKARWDLEEAYGQLEEEQKLSESLLLNVLPHSIATRLKQNPKNLADSYTNVSVLFADIVGFTELSSHISPWELVELLNQIFSEFDALAELHQLEKIKTIGDAYMVVSGLPEPRDDHAQAIADMALDMQRAIATFNNKTGQNFRIRIGIATGPVIAGVIGIKKFIYDLWGDTVNIASRMESHGIPGAIQVTRETYLFLKDEYSFQERGKVFIKGKGEMTTYLLTAKLPLLESMIPPLRDDA